MLNRLIKELTFLAKSNFPVKLTTYLLTQTPNLITYLEPYLFFNEDKYTRNLIFQSPEFELLTLCWMPGQKAPAHGHEGEKCWIRVEQGNLHFVSYKDIIHNNQLELVVTHDIIGSAGYIDGPAYIHTVENSFSEPAVGLHLYAKPFHACDVYVNNKKERHSLSYDTKFGKKI
jgi:cysteine dioxygenase